MENKNMVLVTGGTGFLGSYIIKHLVKKGYRVRAIRREKAVLPFYIPKEIFEKVEWIQGDILDVLSLEEAMEGVDQVIHAAAVVSFLKADRKKMYQVNVEGTANVVNIALEKNVKRLVYISSVAALGRTAHGGSVNEDTKWEDNKVNTHYARSKYKAELEVWRGSGEGLNTIILNPGTILGYGDWNCSSCAIFRNVYNEFKWYTPGINGFVDVDDVARATLLLMESNINDQRYIINGDNWHFKKLQDTMADNFQKKKPSKETTLTLIAMAWRMEKLKSFFNGNRPLLTRESARIAHSKTYFENAKLLAALEGFSFTPLQESIKKACEKYLAALSGAQKLQP
jgi:dihydroflavonol-4-reductase